MSQQQPQGYSDFDAELNFGAAPNFQQQPPPAAYGGDYSQQPQFQPSFDQNPQPSWANQPPPPQFQQPPPQGYYDPSGQNNNGYAQFDQPPEQHHQHHQHEQDQYPPQKVDTTPRHPIACAAHVVFKVAAVLCFWFIGSSSFTPNFITVVCLSAADFWVTKNVSGRLLVGLRWWNEIKEDGTNEWVFESLEGQRQVHQTEAILFWGCLLGNTVAWIVFAFLYILSPSWLVECIVISCLNIANLIGYFKSAREARKRVKNIATSFMVNQAVGFVAGGETKS